MSSRFEQTIAKISFSSGVRPRRDRRRLASKPLRLPAAYSLEKLEPRLALSASSGVHPAASQPSVAQLAAITKMAKDAYVWGLCPESVYRFGKYNELISAPVNQWPALEILIQSV